MHPFLTEVMIPVDWAEPGTGTLFAASIALLWWFLRRLIKTYDDLLDRVRKLEDWRIERKAHDSAVRELQSAKE